MLSKEENIMRYEILGETLPVVICYLESGEKMVTEGGGMSWMSPNMKMETTSNGGIGKIFGRAFSGEKMFQNVYTAQGGEGFIMQKASGHGIMFAEFDGHVVEYELEAGEQIVVDTGHLAAMTASCTMEIKSVPGVKNMLFGGEGVFNTILTGPGKVWLQTMPISNVAGVLSPYFPSSSK